MIMKSTIAAIGLAISLSFATVGIADASPAAPTTRCSDAKAALLKLQAAAAAAKAGSATQRGLQAMVDGLTPQVNRLCP